jgi:hypothetical protein
MKNHRNEEDLQMKRVLSKIKNWSVRYLSKLANHTNALEVDLPNNSETTHRLKRYSVLTLSDRLQ